MFLHLLPILGIYGVLALSREYLVVTYYQAISRQSAGLASALNLGIEFMDLFVSSMIVISILKNQDFIPAIVYASCSSIGTYMAVKLRKKNG